MNIIVNGGSSGIGKEIVLLFGKERDHRILVTGRNKNALKLLSTGAKHKNIVSIVTDLSRFDQQEKSFLERVSSEMNDIDILINIAGGLIVKEFIKFTNSEARELMETNFFGPASVIRIVRPLLKNGSHIVNISSMGGYQGSSKYAGLSYYSASKAALSCLSECLAKEFAGSGIAVNCLALGSVQTEMFAKAFPGLTADVSAKDMAKYIADFALNGNRFYNGKVLPVAVGNP